MTQSKELFPNMASAPHCSKILIVEMRRIVRIDKKNQVCKRGFPHECPNQGKNPSFLLNPEKDSKEENMGQT